MPVMAQPKPQMTQPRRHNSESPKLLCAMPQRGLWCAPMNTCRHVYCAVHVLP
jgi:hypothetical protein